MASIRRRAESNSLLYRVRDESGREKQRSVDIGPTESLAEGRRFYEAIISQREGERAAAGSRYWVTVDCDRIIARCQKKLDAILRAEKELADDA